MSSAKIQDAILGVWNKYSGMARQTVKSRWFVLCGKVSSAVKRAAMPFDSVWTACLDQRRIIQDKMDRLGRHSSAGYAAVAAIKIAFMLFMITFAVEFVFHFRPYYWMMLRFCTYLIFVALIIIIKGTSMMLVTMGTILNYVVIAISKIFMGATRIVAYGFYDICLKPAALLALNSVSYHIITPFSRLAIFLRNNWKSAIPGYFLWVTVKILMTRFWGLEDSSVAEALRNRHIQTETDSFQWERNYVPVVIPYKDLKMLSKQKPCNFKQFSKGVHSTYTCRNGFKWICAETKTSSACHIFAGNSSFTFNTKPPNNMNERDLIKRHVRRKPLALSGINQSDAFDEGKDCERVPMSCGSEEFQTVSKRFHETIPEWKASILMVEKINNNFLRERYNRKRKQIEKTLKSSNCNQIEKRLFHGTTPDVIEAICKQNFDHRVRGKNGTLYGKGSYFAVAASYSDNYSSVSGEETRFMFLASVLTGEYKLGNPDLLRPPLKDPNNPASDLYDSCVDNESQPTIFVIFNDEQCYPLYLIKYRLK